MAGQRFNSREAIQFGWATANRSIGFFIVFIIIVVVISAIPQVLRLLVGGDQAGFLGQLLVAVVWIAVQVITNVGVIRVSLGFADGASGALGDLVVDGPLFFRFLGGYILTVLIISAGLILLIVPGLIWAFRYMFTGFLIVDKGLAPVEALRTSAALTQGEKMNLFVFSLLLAGINILGALALVVGLLWTVPTTTVALASVYRQLQRAQAASG